MSQADVLHFRGRVAGLSRDRLPDDPELLDAKRKLRAENLAVYITELVDAAPPLTAAQRHRLALLLRGGGGGG